MVLSTVAFRFAPVTTPPIPGFVSVSKDSRYKTDIGFGWMMPASQGKPGEQVSAFTAPSAVW